MAENNKVSITKVEAENVLIFSKFEYKPRPGMNVFTGKNAVGKTDVLRLFQAALKGAGAEIIQRGKDKCVIKMNFSDEHSLRRTITQKYSQLKVFTPTGDVKLKPQDFLDYYLGDNIDLSFDPIEFLLKKKITEKRDLLMEVFNIGKIDPIMLEKVLEPEVIARLNFEKSGFDVLKDAENIVFTQRGEINKELVNKKVLYADTLKKIEGWNPETFQGDNSKAINEEIKSIETKLSDAKALKRQAENTKRLVDKLQIETQEAQKELEKISDKEIAMLPVYIEMIANIEQQIADLQKNLMLTKNSLQIARDFANTKDATEKKIAGNKSTIEELPKIEDVPDIEAINTELKNAQENLAFNKSRVEFNEIYQQALHIKTEKDTLEETSRHMSNVLEILRKDLPAELQQTIKMPFDSLSFTDDDVIVNGIHMSLMSTKELLFTVLKIYDERNKNAKLKIILADRIESLDDDSYAELGKFCEEKGYNLFATKVISAKMPEESVLLENGEIKS